MSAGVSALYPSPAQQELGPRPAGQPTSPVAVSHKRSASGAEAGAGLALALPPTPQSLPAHQRPLSAQNLNPAATPFQPQSASQSGPEVDHTSPAPSTALFSWDRAGSPGQRSPEYSGDFEMDLGSPFDHSSPGSSQHDTRQITFVRTNSPSRFEPGRMSTSLSSTSFAPSVHRPYRARYQSPPDSPRSSALFVTAPVALDRAADDSTPPSASLFGPSAKRPFSLVSPSTGTTPPAVDFSQAQVGTSANASAHTPAAAGTGAERPFTPVEDLPGRESPVIREPPPWRHSFEAQRASYSSASARARLVGAESTLRRRSPLPSRAASRERTLASPGPASATTEQDPESLQVGEHLTRARSKRRRASTILPDQHTNPATASSSSSTALTPGFAPAQGPRGEHTASSQSSHSFAPLPRLSFPSLPALAPTAEQPSSPTGSGSPRPRRGSFSAFAGFRRQPSASPAVTATSFQLASPVEVGPTRATGSSSSVALPSERRSATPPTTTLRPRSARARPDPMREREFDPAVSFWREEIRDGQQQPQAAPEFPSARAGSAELGRFEVALADAAHTLANAEGTLNSARTLLAELDTDEQHQSTPPTVTLRSPLLSPRMTIPDESVSSAGPGGRVQHFLTNLRSRRPRLARGSTVPDPAASPPSPSEMGSPISPPPLTSAWLSRLDANAPAWAPARSELDELPPQGASTSTSTGTEPANGTLWGQVAPPSASSSTGSPFPSGLSRRMRGPTERANEAWRQGRAPPAAQAQTTAALPPTTSTTHAAPVLSTPIGVGRRTVAIPAPPPHLPANTSQGQGQLPRAESPSPRSRRAGRRSLLLSLAGAQADDELDEDDEDEEMDEVLAELMMDQDEEEHEEHYARLSLDRQRATFGRRASVNHTAPAPARFAPLAAESTNGESEDGGAGASGELSRSGAVRLPRLARMGHSRVVSRPGTSTMFDWADSQEEESSTVTAQPGASTSTAAQPVADRWRAPILPLMLPSGSQGHRHFFPHPLHTAGQAAAENLPESSPPPRLPAFGFEATRYVHPPGSVRRQQQPAAAPDEASSPTSSNGAHHSLASRISAHGRQQSDQRAARRTTLADALAGLGNRSSAEWEQGPMGILRRRRAASASGGASNSELGTPQRSETLAGLRASQTQVRDLLASDDGEAGQRPQPQLQPREPTARGFLRARSPGRGGVAGEGEGVPAGRRRVGLGNILGRLNAAHHYTQRLFEDDFGAFFGRDAIALQSGNYVDDDDFDTSYEALIRLSERLGDVKPKGVSQDKLEKLTRCKYSDWPPPSRALAGSPPTVVASTSSSEASVVAVAAAAVDGFVKDARCAICLCDYDDDDDILLSDCEHGSHEECLKEWLRERGSCPVCRREQ